MERTRMKTMACSAHKQICKQEQNEHNPKLDHLKLREVQIVTNTIPTFLFRLRKFTYVKEALHTTVEPAFTIKSQQL